MRKASSKQQYSLIVHEIAKLAGERWKRSGIGKLLLATVGDVDRNSIVRVGMEAIGDDGH